MNRGLARCPIFITDDHRLMFFDLLGEVHDRFQAEIHAYCLMKNHYHLLIKTPNGNISRIMRHLDGVYTQRFNKSIKRDGPLFRGRYRSILIDADTYILQLSKYIHLNPVKAKIVKKAEDFIWSSYRAYLSDYKLSWLNTKHTLSYFGNDMQKEKYKMFIEENNDSKLDDYHKKINSIPIFGTEKFTRLIAEKYLQDKHKIDEIPAHKLLAESKSIDIKTILQCVAEFYRIDIQEINIIKKRNGNQARKMAIFLANNIGQYCFTEISSYFCNISPSGVSRACQRTQAEIKLDKKLKQDFDMLRRILLDMSIVQT